MFGIAENVKSKVTECTPERFRSVIDSPRVAKVCTEIKEAYERHLHGKLVKEEYEKTKTRLKKQLPVFTPHATFPGGRRLNAGAVPSGLSMYDKDHIGNPREWWEEKRALLMQKDLLQYVLLIHITPSIEGLRLFFVMPPGMDLAQAQLWMAQQLEDTDYDSCVKDLARCSFAVPRGYILHLDEEGLFNEDFLRHGLHGLHGTHPLADEVFDRSDDTESCGTSVSSNQPEATETRGHENPGNPCNPCLSKDTSTFPQTYQDIPYTDIVEALEEQLGGKPDLGGRNNFIFTMACHMRHVCNDNPHWIAAFLPDYGEEQARWWATIQSACKRHQSCDMPRIMKRVLAVCRKRREALAIDIPISEEEEARPPQMPGNLPPLIKLLLSNTPEVYKPTVAHAVFPALAAHLWQTSFLYIDKVEHEATLMNCLLAETGSGKSCIVEPINRIMADIRARDAVNLAVENEWKNEMMVKGANKDKRKRPAGLVIQEVSPNMTNAAFVMRLKDADGHFLYALMNELDQFDALKTTLRDSSQYQIMCLAFDPNNVYGQVRAGYGSVSEKVCVRFNWNASATIHKGQAYFRKVLVDGPISRINFCTIPQRPIGSDMPRFGTYDAAFDEKLRPYIDYLNGARGLVECRQARNLAKKLVEEKAEEARLSQNRVFENLSFRANVIAFLKACVLYVAHGRKWSKSIEDFVRWSLDYDLWCKMRFFGKAIEEAEKVTDTGYVRGPKNLLDLLPTVFTRAEAGLVREQQGIRTGTLKQMLANWKHRGYIEPYGEPSTDLKYQQYTKTEDYLKKFLITQKT